MDIKKNIGIIAIIIGAVLLYNSNGNNKIEDIPDITLKYSSLFFIVSFLWTIRWLGKNNLERGIIIIIVGLFELIIGSIYIKEHIKINN